jgi:hypothetical protein
MEWWRGYCAAVAHGKVPLTFRVGRGQPRHVCVANHDMFAVEAVAARCREAQMRSAVIGKSCASQEEMR